MKIKLSELIQTLEFQVEDSNSYYDMETGKVHSVWDGMIDGKRAPKEEIEAFDDEDRYLFLPSVDTTDEYEIMRDYVYSLPEGKLQSRLFQAISGRGAFRRFRETLEDLGREDDWERYHDAKIEEIGREWAQSNEIEVEEDMPSRQSAMEEEPEEDGVRKILIVIDMQNDFIDGALGTPEARAIVPAVIKKIKSYPQKDVFATRDTHPQNYLDTQEGKYLPVPHCIKGTKGWQIRKEIRSLLQNENIFDKPTFGSLLLAEKMSRIAEMQDIEIELVGLCTDICVVSNALLLKAYLPDVKISVDPSCCAGVTPEKHVAALETMKSCQIQGI